MERFDVFFSLHVGEGLYSHTDNLSKDLQGTKMAVVSGQRLANLTSRRSQKYSLMIRAQLFESRLALNLGLNLTLVCSSCVQEHFLG